MYWQKTKTGKYRYFESYIEPVTRIRKTTSVTLDRNTTKAKKQAQARLNARISELTGETGKPSDMTLSGLVEAYRAAQGQILRPQTLAHNVIIMSKVAEMFEGVPVDNLTARLVSERFSRLDAAPSKKNGRLRQLRTLLRWGYRMDYVKDVSWLDKVPMYPDDIKARRDLKFLEPEELKKVIESADAEYGLLISALALSGLRIGEALALDASDVDTVIHVTKTLSPTTGEIGPTKTHESNRDIYIQKELKEVFDSANKSGPLFTKGGRRVDYYKFNTYFGDLTKQVLDRRLTPHALRHTHVSLLAAAGVPLEVIGRRLGHNDSKITREIYFHVTESLKDKDAALLDAITLL